MASSTRYCCEYMYVADYGMRAWGIVDKRRGRIHAMGYILDGEDAQLIVRALNSQDSVNATIERTA